MLLSGLRYSLKLRCQGAPDNLLVSHNSCPGSLVPRLGPHLILILHPTQMRLHAPQTFKDEKSVAYILAERRRQQVRKGSINAIQLRNLIESGDQSEIVLRPNRCVEFPLDRPPHSSDTGRCLLAEKSHRLLDILGRYISQFFIKPGSQAVSKGPNL